MILLDEFNHRAKRDKCYKEMKLCFSISLARLDSMVNYGVVTNTMITYRGAKYWRTGIDDGLRVVDTGNELVWLSAKRYA